MGNEQNPAEFIALGNEEAFEYIYKHYYPNLGLCSNKFICDLTVAVQVFPSSIQKGHI
ncbi:MAG: hypothetical protein JW982_03400 [Spirochaetes bacterium]|nr:hypothetical protein [Spirochaetota bacterium]